MDKPIKLIFDKVGGPKINTKKLSDKGCLGYHDEWNGDYDCGYGATIACEDCKYGMGRKDPEAKRNQL